MTDREKILAEIERLKKELYKQQDVRFDESPIPVYDTNAIDGMLKVLDEVKGFINSLPAELSENLETSKDPENDSDPSETLYTYEQMNILVRNQIQLLKKIVINEACEWLQKHINDYLVHGRDIDFLYDDFRKAMEDKQ